MEFKRPVEVVPLGARGNGFCVQPTPGASRHANQNDELKRGTPCLVSASGASDTAVAPGRLPGTRAGRERHVAAPSLRSRSSSARIAPVSAAALVASAAAKCTRQSTVPGCRAGLRLLPPRTSGRVHRAASRFACFVRKQVAALQKALGRQARRRLCCSSIHSLIALRLA